MTLLSTWNALLADWGRRLKWVLRPAAVLLVTALGVGGVTLAHAQPVVMASANEGHTMFVKSDGTLWATGLDEYGQLGDGKPAFLRLTPYQVGNGVSSVSAGHHHTLWVKSDGTLWAVGRNNYGQLGDGTIVLYRTAPVQVAAGVASVAAGLWHTMFVKTDGTMWAMGNNGYGQLGDGTKVDRISPVQVATGVAAVAVGDAHTMFLKTDGTLWAVGFNQYGQLGDGATLPFGTNRDNPVQVATGVASIAAFSNQSYFVKTNGSLYAMGFNGNGQLGDSSNVSKSSPTLIDTGVVSASGGLAHMIYVKANGTLWATGNNAYGQLGDGSSAGLNVTTPELIASGVASVAAGYVHSMFVKTDGTLWGMGYNQYGTLGDGLTTTTQLTPVQVATTVPAPPTISVQPVNQSAGVGATFSFSVEATGVGPLTYQWYLDRAAIPFATDATFSATAQPVRAGVYTVTITNAGGIVTSAAATLTLGLTATTFSLATSNLTYTGVAQGPTIVTSPAFATFTAGGTLTATNVGSYTATATATGAYSGSNSSLAWSIVKAPASIALTALGVTYSGAPKAVIATTLPSGLTVNLTYNGSPTAPTNAGSYAVVATVADANYTGTASGTLVIAKVSPAITWASPAPVTAGASLSGTQLNATATVPGTFTYSPAAGTVLAAGVQTLGVTFTPTDTTNYSSVTATVTVTVQGLTSIPAITTQPASQTFAVGYAVTLGTAASGTPAPTYQWQKDGVNIPGATSAVYSITSLVAGDAGSYRVVASNSAGTAMSSTAVLTVVPRLPAAGNAADFNGDGKPDLLWSNALTGERAMWLMNGTNFLFGSTLGLFPLEWTIAATGDFNADGKSDLIWSNALTGERAIWLMSGTSLATSSTLGIFPLEWTIAATGDFDGDGQLDIIWSNRLTGERAIWLMTGTSFKAASTLGVFPLEWTVAATGDFNADGKPDIVWSNSVTGERAIWLMNGTTFLGASTLGIFPLEWTVAGTADFNADGKPDLIWSNSITGERALWLMSGTTFLGASTLGTFPLEWTVKN